MTQMNLSSRSVLRIGTREGSCGLRWQGAGIEIAAGGAVAPLRTVSIPGYLMTPGRAASEVHRKPRGLLCATPS